MDNRKFITAVLISLAILIGWQYFIEAPRLAKQQEALQRQQAQQAATQPAAQSAPQAEAPQPAPVEGARKIVAREVALKESPRVSIESARLKGSIALMGARIDDLVLKEYRETVRRDSSSIVLLSPLASKNAYYADFGWAAEAGIAVPTSDSLWTADSKTLTPAKDVTLTWDNGQGLVFTRRVALDEHFMFTISDSVANKGGGALALTPYARAVRYGTPADASQTYVLHEGLIAVLEGTLKEFSYGSVKEDGEDGVPPEQLTSTGGWIGITDKYWLVAPVPPQDEAITTRFFYDPAGDFYQSDYAGVARQLEPGQSISVEQRLFAGAKQVRILKLYRDGFGIPLFDRAVDFGWFFFLTQPLFYLLDSIVGVVGNFGIAILVLTVIVKLAMYPLANKSYASMNRMKMLAPQMTELREKHGEDKARLNQEMMALYKREKVNPASGCLPIFVQIPVFYALYKVLYVTIEMRHAPFFGWIRDLSAPDPTSVLNLFGLLPWDPASAIQTPYVGGILAILSIGVWPLIMGGTMWVQQKLNPTPPDPVQARIFAMLPIIFTFMLGQFAAGLVIYWAWNNLLSIAQQKIIMARMEAADKAKAKAKA